MKLKQAVVPISSQNTEQSSPSEDVSIVMYDSDGRSRSVSSISCQNTTSWQCLPSILAMRSSSSSCLLSILAVRSSSSSGKLSTHTDKCFAPCDPTKHRCHAGTTGLSPILMREVALLASSTLLGIKAAAPTARPAACTALMAAAS